MRRRNDAGFALIGTLVAASLATFMLAVVQRVVPKKQAPQPTLTSILAEQKLEELRGLTWGSLQLSPAGALQQNTDGFVEYLDARGVLLGGGLVGPKGTSYTRRWSVEPLRSNPEEAFVIQVLVSSSKRPSASGPFPVRLTALRTRNPLLGHRAE